MKYILNSFFALSALVAAPAFAEDVGIVTKDYVDDGLIYVYREAKKMNTSTQNDLNELTEYVGKPADELGPATGLTATVNNLSTQIQNIQSTSAYTGDGRGVFVTPDRRVGITGLNMGTSQDGKMYVFKNNEAEELQVVEYWDDDGGGL